MASSRVGVTTSACATSLRLDLHEDRQQERQCLPGPGLGLHDGIAASTHDWYRLFLYGGGLLYAHVSQSIQQHLADAQLAECRHYEESTSVPVSVMRIVFSHCADRLWSFVRTVQPFPLSIVIL